MRIESSLHGNKVLWRYLDLEKFLDLILNERLFLSRASILTDQYELSLPIENQDRLNKYLQKKYPDKELQKTKAHSIRKQILRIRESTYIASWSKHTDESYALWKIYLSDNKIGVAIKTTMSKLKKSITGIEHDFVNHLLLREIEYSSFRKFDDLIDEEGLIKKHSVICNKSNFYKYEEEARLYTIVWDATNNYSKIKTSGIYLYLKPSILIDEIILSPFVKEWFKPSFEKMIASLRPDFSFLIKNSKVADY